MNTMTQFDLKFRPSFHPDVDIFLIVDGTFAMWELNFGSERWIYDDVDLTAKEIETIPAVDPFLIRSSRKSGLDGMSVAITYTNSSGESVEIHSWSPNRRRDGHVWELLSGTFPLLKRCAIEETPKKLLENLEYYLD